MIGIWTAIITPFDSRGGVCFESLRRLAAAQQKAGVTGLVACGTTGEAPTLSLEEKQSMAQFLKTNFPDLSLMVGTGSSCTQTTVELSRQAVGWGADALLVVTPPYNKPNPSGLLQHYSLVADAAAGIPICLYHVPGRTAQSLSPSLLGRLTEISNITLVKEASGDMDLFSEALRQSRSQYLSGDDFTFLPSLALGGQGVISVISNLCPFAMVQLWRAFRAGDTTRAQKIHDALMPLTRAMFVETNPVPVKFALQHLFGYPGKVRLPLGALESSSEAVILDAIAFTRSRLVDLGLNDDLVSAQ